MAGFRHQSAVKSPDPDVSRLLEAKFAGHSDGATIRGMPLDKCSGASSSSAGSMWRMPWSPSLAGVAASAMVVIFGKKMEHNHGGESWSAFAVDAKVEEQLFKACRTEFRAQKFTLSRITLICGHKLPSTRSDCTQLIAFAFEELDGNYARLLADDGDFAAPLSRRLGSEVWVMTGGSNVDDSDFECYRNGRQVLYQEAYAHSLPRHSPKVGFDLEALRQWAEFGISGAEPIGLGLRLSGSGKPDLGQLASAAAEAALKEPQRRDLLEEAIVLIDQAAAAGDLSATSAALMCLNLGESKTALPFAIKAGQGDYLGKTALARVAVAAEEPHHAAYLVDDVQVPLTCRLPLMDALGQGEQALAIRIEQDMPGGYPTEAEKALDQPDPTQRVKAFMGLSFDPGLHPGWDLVRRCEVAKAKLQLGTPIPANLVDELTRWSHSRLAGWHQVLSASPDDPIAVLRVALQVAQEAGKKPSIIYAHADLGLALARIGSTEAAKHLEEAYINLGASSAYTGEIEKALKQLGLF